jgi:hypothetical protein
MSLINKKSILSPSLIKKYNPARVRPLENFANYANPSSPAPEPTPPTPAPPANGAFSNAFSNSFDI